MWGLSFKDIRKLSYPQYYKLWLADQYRKAFELDKIRRLESTTYNFGGMGSEKVISPSDWLKIGLIDSDEVKLPITTQEKALELFKNIVLN